MPSGYYLEGRGSLLAEARTFVFRAACIPTPGSPILLSSFPQIAMAEAEIWKILFHAHFIPP